MALTKIRRRVAALEEKVEQRFPKPKPPSRKEIARRREFIGRLVPTMAPEHISLFEAYLKDAKRAPIPQGLADIFFKMWRAFREGSARQVALPPAVVEVYLQNPNVYGTDDCADCGLLLPRGYFFDCPLCGGVTGSMAYDIKQKTPGYQYLTPYRRDGDPRREYLKDGIRRSKKDASNSLKDLV